MIKFQYVPDYHEIIAKSRINMLNRGEDGVLWHCKSDLTDDSESEK